MLKKSTLSISITVCLLLSFSYAAAEKWERSRADDFTGEEGHMKAIHFINAKYGWGAGDYGIIVSTKDGGATWEKLDSRMNKDLWDVQFVNDKTGWVSGENGTILYTKDGGKGWRRQDSVSTVALYGIYCNC